MSFLGRFKSSTTPSSPPLNTGATKDTSEAHQTALEKHLAELTGSTRADGSDKFFGFENYGSTCYCNSIVQCLYFSPTFRERILNFPYRSTTDGMAEPSSPTVKPKELPPTTPGPLAVNSPARRPIVLPGAALAVNQRPDEKDSPEYKKKMLMQTATMLDMQLALDDAHDMDESLLTALKDIFQAISTHTSRTGIVSPHRFLEILRRENEIFRNAMHQDAHEFMNFLLNQVVDSVDLYNKRQRDLLAPEAANGTAPKSWVHDLFEGLLVSETRCLTCETVSQRDEAFMDLSVDLEAHSTVTSCLRKFSEEEMLCERNKFYCDNCNGLQEAEKRMKIKRLPRILALHLKRFEYTEDYGRLQKLFHRVSYPFHLRLFNTTDDAEGLDRVYELYAVVVHIGGGPYHGHYVSIIKTQDRGWLLFDDELVEPVDKSYVQSFFGGEAKVNGNDPKALACAYVLFYHETTEEAVRAEEDTEKRAEAARTSTNTARASDASTPGGSPWIDGNQHAQTVSIPQAEDEGDKLAQATTSPVAEQPPESKRLLPTMPRSTSLGFGGRGESKAKREARKEEKMAEKERKASAKEIEKLSKARQKQEGEAREHHIRPIDLGAAPLSPTMDAMPAEQALDTTFTEPMPVEAPNAETLETMGNGSKAKRTSSINLRQRFWSSGRSREKDSDGQSGQSAQPVLAPVVDNEPLTSPISPTKEENPAKRSRFSLTKKRVAHS